MKKITELTKKEAIDILKFVYPYKNIEFEELSLEPKILENGSIQVSIDMRPLVGIIYKGEYGDRCILHFDNSKAALWLYRNGYDIEEILVSNAYFSEMEEDLDELGYQLHLLSSKPGEYSHFNIPNTVDEFREKCNELNNKYIYKDYEEVK